LKKSGIYIIRNSVNKKVYIGQSVDMVSRFTNHLYYLRENRHGNPGLQRLYNKYGESVFNFSILEECDKSKLDEKEIWYIKYYNSYKNGYNRTEGGKPAISENIHNNKNKTCKVCGIPVETKWHKYCDAHKYICPKCGTRNDYKKYTCKECESLNAGETISQCEVCGKKITKASNRQKYCKECGKRIKYNKVNNINKEKRKLLKMK